MTPVAPAANAREPFGETVPGAPLISFKDIHLGFEDGDVLRGISFDVWPGETKILLGEGGSGKTLLMKLAAGLLQPDAGNVTVMGKDIGAMAEKELLNFRRHIGFVFQEGALFDSMTVAQNVSFRLDEENVDETEIETRVREALRFVEMEPSIEKYPGELSGGMRRRVSIARALVDRPPLVFYDSPTAGLDPVTCQTIITLIMRGRDSQGVTSLLATQRVQDAFGLANFRFDETTGHIVRENTNGAGTQEVAARGVARTAEQGQREPPTRNGAVPPTNVVVLRNGKIYFEGAAGELLHSPDVYLKEFLASAE
jgi:phospholipid/cholesterol/gamma-HCH transport system ATP-binding protein